MYLAAGIVGTVIFLALVVYLAPRYPRDHSSAWGVDDDEGPLDS